MWRLGEGADLANLHACPPGIRRLGTVGRQTLVETAVTQIVAGLCPQRIRGFQEPPLKMRVQFGGCAPAVAQSRLCC